jgi:GTPase SAR1 family protein
MGLLTIIRKNKCAPRRSSLTLAPPLTLSPVKDRELRLLFLGLDNSGKSSIVRRILGEDIAGVSPTLGFDIRTVVHRG